jgi:membrane protein
VLLALASFFPLQNLTDDLAQTLGPFVSPGVLTLILDQMTRLSSARDGGLLTFGVLGALWSSSAAIVSIVGALNRAYDIQESRPWWKVRLTAIGLTIGIAVFFLCALSLVLAGPALARYLGEVSGLGTIFEWTWLVVQWPVAFAFVATGIGLVFYFAPDAEQDWVWITPGAVVATILWLIASVAFKFYVANFTDYNASYGAVGGVIVLLLWFYVTGLAILTGAELNAEIEHASPYGKDPGEKSASGRRLLGARARRAYEERLRSPQEPAPGAAPMPVPATVLARSQGRRVPGILFASALLLIRTVRGRRAATASETREDDRARDRARA